VKEDLQQEIAQFLAQFGVVAGSNGVVHLVRFFYQVRPQRLVRLRGIPLAPCAQIAHQ
jgi:hypothetical protein